MWCSWIFEIACYVLDNNILSMECCNNYRITFSLQISSGPPTACRNIRINLLGDRRIDVVWQKPFFTGRGDIYYVLEWSTSLSSSLLTTLGFSDREINGSATIFDGSDTVSHSITGLRPDTPYSVSVTARNGVSDQGGLGSENSSRCQLQGTTINGKLFSNLKFYSTKLYFFSR
jgi:hypothetical protein